MSRRKQVRRYYDRQFVAILKALCGMKFTLRFQYAMDILFGRWK